MIAWYINLLLQRFGIEVKRIDTLQRRIDAGKYRWLQEKGIKTIIDIGANVGQFAEMIRPIIPSAMIYSFEPLESCFSELKLKEKTLSPFQCFQYGLGDKNEIKEINHNKFTQSSSLLTMEQRHKDAFPYTKDSYKESISIVTLDSVISNLAIESPLFVKIDVQGYELNVLRGAAATLPMIDILIVEVSFTRLYENQPLFEDINKELRKYQFEYVGNFEQLTDPINGAVLQADAIYINRTMG